METSSSVESDSTGRFKAFQPGGALYALSFPNFRLFFVGQLVSVAGTWMQMVAQQWLVFDLTHSASWLGIVSGASAIPYVLFAFWGGEVADRFPRRTTLVWTQTLAMIFAFVLAGLATNTVVKIQAWHIAVLAALGGIVNAFNMPAQQAFVTEMVSDSRAMRNAITLNSLRFNVSRFLGPMLAGIALVQLSVSACFFLNGLSFLAVLFSLSQMRLPAHSINESTENQAVTQSQTKGETWEGLRFIGTVPALLRVVLLVSVASLLVLSASTLYPVLAEQYARGASGFSTIVTVNGLGATFGGIGLVLLGNRISGKYLVYGGATALCCALLCLSLKPVFPVLLTFVFFAGISMVTFTTSANTKVQEDTPNRLRGRVMAVFSLVINGLIPAGSLFLGFCTERFGPFLTIRFSAFLCLIATLFLFQQSRTHRREPVV